MEHNTSNPQRCDIWLVNLDPTIGSEIKKRRPAVIISSNSIRRFPTRIIVPLTGWLSKYDSMNMSWLVPIPKDKYNNLTKKSGADASQIRTVDVKRFVHKIGTVTDKQAEDITYAIALCIELDVF